MSTRSYIGDNRVVITKNFGYDNSGFYWYYKSSDNNVLNVDRVTGKTKALKAGSGYVSATFYNGRVSYSFSSDALRINVTEPKITIDGKSFLPLGDTTHMTKQCIPYEFENIQWSSSDEKVATIDNDGNVTALSPGYTYISVSGYTKSGVYVKDSVYLDVNYILISDFKLNLNSYIGHVNDTFSLVPKYYPENATEPFDVSWRSTDNEIATVDDNGNVTLKSIGSCIIIFDYYLFNRKGSYCFCHITVEPVIIESVTLDPKEWCVSDGNTFNINAIILPENASDKRLVWKSSDREVATVNNEGVVTIHKKDGSCIITAMTCDGSNLSAECTISSKSGIDTIFNDPDELFDVFNTQGVMIKKECNRDGLKLLSPGIYIIHWQNTTKKIAIH